MTHRWAYSHGLDKHKELFKDGYGKRQGFQVKVMDPRQALPLCLKEARKRERERLEKIDITKVNGSDWAAPIVVVPKEDETETVWRLQGHSQSLYCTGRSSWQPHNGRTHYHTVMSI